MMSRPAFPHLRHFHSWLEDGCRSSEASSTVTEEGRCKREKAKKKKVEMFASSHTARALPLSLSSLLFLIKEGNLPNYLQQPIPSFICTSGSEVMDSQCLEMENWMPDSSRWIFYSWGRGEKVRWVDIFLEYTASLT